MTYTFDQTTDGRWYLFWNGEFVGFVRGIHNVRSLMDKHMGIFSDGSQ